MNLTEDWDGTGSWPSKWVTLTQSGPAPVATQVSGNGQVIKSSGDGTAAIYVTEPGASWIDSEQTVKLSASSNLVRGGLISRRVGNSYYACEVGASNADRLRIFKVEDGIYIPLKTAASDTSSFLLAKNVKEALTFKTEQLATGTRLTATLRTAQPNVISINIIDTTPILQGAKAEVGVWVRVGGSGFRSVNFDSYVGPELPPTIRFWSASTSWPDGVVPAPNASVVVTGAQPMVLDTSVSVADITISAGSKLVFDPTLSLTLESAGNINGLGTLEAKPISHSVVHTIKITGANESLFVGGGMMMLPTDIGLWVQESGKLDLLGSPKTPWTRLATSAVKGSNQLSLIMAPVGWQVGDDIVVTPTSDDVALDKPNNAALNSWGQFQTYKIASVSGTSVILTTQLIYNHPLVEIASNHWIGAEVLNLTRNVKIQGMPPLNVYPRVGQPVNFPGRSHIFIHNTTPVAQQIRRVEIRHMGPRKAISTKESVDVLGRYAVHFHHCMDNSAGSVVRDSVVRDCGSHAFVPHASHNTMFCGCISYNTTETPFWWDSLGDEHNTRTDGTMILTPVAARVMSDGSDANLNGYLLGSGKDNMLISPVAVGVQGNSTSAGYHWPSHANDAEFNVWALQNAVSHNNKCNGARVWQNDSQPHEVLGFIAYHNFAAGVDHGAYRNPYVWEGTIMYANGLGGVSPQHIQHNNSKKWGIGARGQGQIMDVTVDAKGKSANILHITTHGLPPENDTPFLFLNWTAKNATARAILVNEVKDIADGQPVWGLFDFVNWVLDSRELEPSDFTLYRMNLNSRIRVQRNDGTAFEIRANGVQTSFITTVIPAFWPYP